MSDNHNKLAKDNGDWGERRALQILSDSFPNVQYVSDLIDFYSETGIPIEVKTCQERIEAYPYGRQGRYILMKEQHETLLTKEGFYLFLVKSGSLLMKARLVKASDIPTFKAQINWRDIHGSV